MQTTSSSQQERDDILAARLDAIHSSSPASFAGLIGAAIALYVFWAPATKVALLLWVSTVLAIATTNVVTAAMRVRGRPLGWTNATWARFIIGMHLVSGLTWGIGGGWMLSISDEHQALMIMAIGMAAVMVCLTSVVFQPAYQAYQVPIFLGYAVGALLSSLQFRIPLTIGFLALCAFSIVIAQTFGQQLVDAIRLSIENKRLARRLEERSVALETANRELEIESSTDPLTGVANRRRLMTFARATRDACAMLVIDIDHFKSYNDSFGHVEGDACLVAVADALQQNARPGHDLVARLGGEEFAAVLVDISEAAALQIAETMRRNVEALQSLRPKSIRRVVTVSIGVSVRLPDQDKPLVMLMEEADAAVYRAKTGGRNRVCAGKPEKRSDVA